MPIRTIDELSHDARDVAASYLDAFASSLVDVPAEERAEVVDELSAHLLASLSAADTPERVSQVAAGLGLPEPVSVIPEGGRRLSGRFLGVPYELGVPTAEHVSSRLWDPSNPSVFVPRIFGIGWDVNMGAIAVKLRLIEPDAENVPFSSTPRWAFSAGLAVPCVALALMAGTYLAFSGSFPAELPSHWNIAGEPDDWWAPLTTFGLMFLLGGAPTVWAVVATMRRREPFVRGALIGLASFAAALAASLWALTLITTFTGFSAWWLPPLMIFGSLIVPMGVLLGLARAGRAAEVKRDLAQGRSVAR